jgi:2-methylcitrate dehydratase PrpD
MEYKPYSCARPIHNAIDCALNIRAELKEPLSRVSAITVRRHPAWAHYHGNPAPGTYHEAQVSLPYSVAVALVEGAALLPQYLDEKLSDPAILRLAGLVKIVPDDTLSRGVSCLMTLETDTGAVHRALVDHPRGSIANPMSADEIRRKVHVLADGVIGRSAVAELIDVTEHITTLPRIAELTRAIVPDA